MLDVFARQPFSGNPLPVVVDAEGLDTDAMLAITRWMNQSETTFLLPPTDPEADYRVRIFTLQRELPFAGHPTLGSCQAWLNQGGQPRDPERIVQQCGAGLIPVRRSASGLAFAAPPLSRSGPVDDAIADEVAEVLQVPRSSFLDIAWADNGPGWIGVLMESASAVLALQARDSHPNRVDIGVVGAYPAGDEFACEVRAFYSDQNGAIREDPVTGSLNASLAQWLAGSGRFPDAYRAHQGTALGRDGVIDVAVEAEDTWIGGQVLSLFQGTAAI